MEEYYHKKCLKYKTKLEKLQRGGSQAKEIMYPKIPVLVSKHLLKIIEGPISQSVEIGDKTYSCCYYFTELININKEMFSRKTKVWSNNDKLQIGDSVLVNKKRIYNTVYYDTDDEITRQHESVVEDVCERKCEDETETSEIVGKEPIYIITKLEVNSTKTVLSGKKRVICPSYKINYTLVNKENVAEKVTLESYTFHHLKDEVTLKQTSKGFKIKENKTRQSRLDSEVITFCKNKDDKNVRMAITEYLNELRRDRDVFVTITKDVLSAELNTDRTYEENFPSLS